MTDITLRNDFTVEVIQQCGNDLMLAKAAWVSTGIDSTDPDKLRGTLKFLMENRHGTPFEHGFLTIRVEAPIFIWREWHRHRIGFSYNEESGRYKKLDPVFYVPGEERSLYCIKPPNFRPSRPGFRGLDVVIQANLLEDNHALLGLYEEAYQEYERRLSSNYDNGLARICLPVSIYSACYVSCNPRSLMALLELRTDRETATRRSYPLWEFHRICTQVEEIFKVCWPLTYELWNNNGRVAP